MSPDVTPASFAPFSFAPVRRAPLRLDPVKSAFVRSAFVRFAPPRSADGQVVAGLRTQSPIVVVPADAGWAAAEVRAATRPIEIKNLFTCGSVVSEAFEIAKIL